VHSEVLARRDFIGLRLVLGVDGTIAGGLLEGSL